MKTLSKEEVSALLKKEHKEEIVSVKVQEWPSLNDKVALHKAVQSKSDTVTFEDDRVFTITYKEKPNLVFLRPDSPEFVPCGYFDLKKVQDEIEELI